MANTDFPSAESYVEAVAAAGRSIFEHLLAGERDEAAVEYSHWRFLFLLAGHPTISQWFPTFRDVAHEVAELVDPAWQTFSGAHYEEELHERHAVFLASIKEMEKLASGLA